MNIAYIFTGQLFSCPKFENEMHLVQRQFAITSSAQRAQTRVPKEEL